MAEDENYARDCAMWLIPALLAPPIFLAVGFVFLLLLLCHM
jgi:hypothetical protein